MIQEELEEASEESFHWPEIKKSDGRKMKTVFWDKLSHHQVMSSMWVYIYKQFPDIKINKILDLYEDKIHRKKPSASAEKKKPQSTKQTFIYDDQRKQSISIGVTKLLYINRLSWEQIVEMILKVDEKVLGLDAFVNMKVLAPLANEMELCRAYKGRVEELDVASRWVLELQKIPAFAARFDCLEFVNGFEEQYTRLKKIVDEYKGLCDYLVDSSEIQKLLRVLLDAGNIVNSGTRRGDAYGFRLESLKDFLNCKSPLKKGLSLLEYVLTEIHAQTPSILEFSKPLFNYLENCHRHSIESTIQIIIQVKQKINRMRIYLENAEKPNVDDRNFIAKFEPFFLENAEKIVILEETSIEVKKNYFETMIFVGENQRKLKKKKSDEILVKYFKVAQQIQNIVQRLQEKK